MSVESSTSPAPGGAGQVLLSAKNIRLEYRSKKSTTLAVDDLSMDIARGDFVSVLGPSGCGKSTLIKMFSGLLKPTAGSIELNGTPVTQPRGDVGIVFQTPTLLPWKNVLDNVLVPVRALGKDSPAQQAKALELLRLIGLERFAKSYPAELSGGMQQRVGIARGLMHDPDLLLMDEPFSALDTMTRDHMSLELQRIWMATRKSVLFITHSIPEAVFLSDRIVVMSARPGRITRVIDVDLPRPRTLATLQEPRFNQLCGELRTLFEELVHFD
jgi:NitT/TauT family transport system ATP-binding protein